MFIGSGPGHFEGKPSPEGPEPSSWDYNRLVNMDYSLGGRIGWQLASCMAEAYRRCRLPLPEEIEHYFPQIHHRTENDPQKTDQAIRAAQKFFPAWNTNAVKCHEGGTYTSRATELAMKVCVDTYLKGEIRLIKPRFIITLGSKAIPVAWWHNPQFNGHKDNFVALLERIFRRSLFPKG